MYNFNYDGSKFRLHINNPQYFVNEKKKTITLVADTVVDVPEYIMQTIAYEKLPQGFGYDTSWVGIDTVKMTVTVKCHEDDVFDVEKGKKIAMAKLEARAYQRFIKTLGNWRKRFNTFIDSLDVMYMDFVRRAGDAAEHDLKYIDEIS